LPSRFSVQGLWVALLSPLDRHGALQSAVAVAHAQRLLHNGCEGIALFGTTGEGPAFTVAERMQMLEAMLGAGIAAERLMVTTSAVAIGDAIALGRHAAGLGVWRQMYMPPFYFRQPRAAGVVEAVARVVEGIGATRLQLLLYHFPAISSVEFTHAAIAELVRRFPEQIVGIKDSSANLEHTLGLVRAFPQLSVLVGAENHIAPVMAAGGAGSINALANFAPALLRRVADAPSAASVTDLQSIDRLLQLQLLRPAMPFVSVCKTILAEQTGNDLWCNVRAPLVPLDALEAQAVRAGFRALALMPENSC
jgi:4-hydroxy-tetrahydrodipicolinate synthase